jgi:DNA polymerase-4
LDRTILHCDMNGFFASVELLTRPDLKDRPVAVCGDPESRRGIVLAKNELAKRFGVQTAETIGQAQRKCPGLVLLPAHHDLYEEYSIKANEIYGRFTDLVEPFGIDESWLDVTGCLHLFGLNGKELADRIRETVKSELGLTCSVGVSYNKIFAKLGSDYRKPDATTVLDRGNFQEIVFPLPVSALLYVGKVATETLSRVGVKTIGQLAALDRRTCSALLGKLGELVHDYANGLDESPVIPESQQHRAKSIGNGMTFPRDLLGREDVLWGVALLVDSVGMRLRSARCKCRTVQVLLRSPDFKSISRQKKLERSTHSTQRITEAAMDIIGASWNWSAPIRMITVTAQGLEPEDTRTDASTNPVESLGATRPAGAQRSLFDEEETTGPAGSPPPDSDDRSDRLDATMDSIRERFGRDAVGFGREWTEGPKRGQGPGITGS